MGYDRTSLPLMFVELCNTGKRCGCHGLLGFIVAAPVDHFRLVQPIDGLFEGVILPVSTIAYRRVYAGLGEALGIENPRIVEPAIRMMNEPVGISRLSRIQCGVLPVAADASAKAHDRG